MGRSNKPDVLKIEELLDERTKDWFVWDVYAAELGVDSRFFSITAGDLEYLWETMPKHRSARVLKEFVRLILDEHESDRFHA